MILNWKVSKEDHELIAAIAERAERMTPDPAGRPERQRVNFLMDLTAVHANGNALDLAGLLAADDYNFTHDVYGIARHLDRTTGKLMDCFVPRYSAAPQEAK